MRPLPILFAIVLSLLAAAGMFRLSYGYFQSEELSKAEGRLSLYRSTVTAELERFSHLPFVLARDRVVMATARGGNTNVLNARLRDFAQKSGLDAIYLINLEGKTISASNAGETSSFVGQNYAFRPYFQQALAGQQGRFYGIGATTGLPGYFIADPVRNGAGEITGVIAIKIDLSKLQNSWRESGEQVFLSNGDGVVLLSSDPAWRYKALDGLTAAQRDAITASRQFPGQPLDRLDWSPTADQRAVIGGAARLHLTAPDLPHGWALHYFTSDDRAVARSWLVTASAVLLLGLALLWFQGRRTRRIGAALRRSEQEEAQLRAANERLAVEIEERRTAERRLKRTQDELESASRLAALGQLAASVTHELGQPIAAMRNYLAAAEIGQTDGVPIVGKIGALVDRMEGITRQLKFFARTDRDAFGKVDLGEALQASLALVAPNVEAAGVTVGLALPDAPVIVRGNKLRLEQVMTNILLNAIDAVEGVKVPRLDIRAGQSGKNAWFEVTDNGHGLGEATLADLQEPFVTTRESGRGMGLGLAISAGIISDHGGQMTARNRANAGAVFRVEFPEAGDEASEAA